MHTIRSVFVASLHGLGKALVAVGKYLHRNARAVTGLMAMLVVAAAMAVRDMNITEWHQLVRPVGFFGVAGPVFVALKTWLSDSSSKPEPKPQEAS